MVGSYIYFSISYEDIEIDCKTKYPSRNKPELNEANKINCILSISKSVTCSGRIYVYTGKNNKF